MTTVTIKNEYLAQIPATDTKAYEAPPLTTARVLKCTITNDTTTAGTVSAHKVESGGSVGDDKFIMNAQVIGPKETYECPQIVGQVINPEMFLSFIASVATQFTLSLDVGETV